MNSTLPKIENPFIALDGIVDELQSVSENCTWFISSDKIISILNIRKEDYYKRIYALKDSDFNPAGLRGFHETEGESFCKLISILLKVDFAIIEESLFKAGVFLCQDTLSLAEKHFLKVLEFGVGRHKLDKDLLMLLNTATLTFDDAFDSYFDDKFEMETMIERSVNSFLDEMSVNIDFGADSFLKNYLLERLKFKKDAIENIKSEYRERYYYELYGRVRKEKVNRKVSHELLILLRFFQLDENADRLLLKKRYQELLKKFHPDINKNGLEKTKEIIEKYKKLDNLLLVDV